MTASSSAAQRAADQAGSLVEFVDGIAFVYRRLGYDYALPWPMRYAVPPGFETPEGYEVRTAAIADLAGIVAVADAAQRAADVACQWTASHWRWAIERDMPHEVFHVATAGGEIAAFARTAVSDDDTWVALVAGRDASAVRAVLSRATAAGTPAIAHVSARADPVVATVCAGIGTDAPETTGLYARLPDALGLLRALQPELSRRLRTSPWQDRRGTVTLSTYRTGFRLAYDGGAVTAIDRVDPLLEPMAQGGVGVPDDHFAAFVLGRRDPSDAGVDGRRCPARTAAGRDHHPVPAAAL